MMNNRRVMLHVIVVLLITLFISLYIEPAQSLSASKTTHSKVLFDAAHGQRFLPDTKGPLQLSALNRRFKQSGIDLIVDRQPITAKVLSNHKALILSGPFIPFTESEIQSIVEFVRRGGRLSIMLHIGSPAKPLLKRFGILVSNGVIQEQSNTIDENSRNFYTSSLQPHPLTHGLKRFALYGVWALKSAMGFGQAIAQTSKGAWVDMNRDKRMSKGDIQKSFDIVMEGGLDRGRFVVFGDDALFQNQFLHGENAELADNLAQWLLASKTKYPGNSKSE